MAITLTKKVTGTYSNTRPVLDEKTKATIDAYINDQVTAGKTDGNIDWLGLTSHVRLWSDQDSAQAYVDFIVSTVAGFGRNDLTNEITDI
jgi:hypothetical protein